MNFLAHAWLAAQTDSDARQRAALIVGGVVGDWIQGPLESSDLPADLRQGVALHRAIDRFADTQPAFMRSRARISAPRRRWSGVFIDMFYDHLLAANWARWHPAPLIDFTGDVYSQIGERRADLPPDSLPALDLMCREDWLAAYADEAALNAILGRMSRRARQPNPLAEGGGELAACRAAYDADCAEFLAAAREFSRRAA